MPLMAQSYWKMVSDDQTCLKKGTAYCAEKTSPNTEVTTENGSARLDGSKRTYPALAVGAIAETFNTVPDGTTDGTHAEGTSEVAQGNPWAGIARVIHCVLSNWTMAKRPGIESRESSGSRVEGGEWSEIGLSSDAECR